MNATKTPSTLGLALAALGLLLSCGCFQIETRVKLHEDGSATITERYQLSRRIMEFENPGGGPVLASELTKEAVTERMKSMGKGISLVSHELRDAEGGGRESVSVFKIPDITELQYASPYVALPGYSGRCLMKCQLSPRLKADGHPPGLVVLTFDPVVNDPAKAKVEPPPKIDEKNPPKGPSPGELQVFRHLQPVVRDLLEGLCLKFTVESYASAYDHWQGPPVRNRQANTHEWDLVSVSDKDLDAFGANFLENEEVMLELEQGLLGGPNMRQHLGGMFGNLTLPLFYITEGGYWWRPPVFWFRPSRPLFDKLFAGKTLDFGAGNGGKRPAKFEEIGWQPPPTAAKP